MSGPVWRVLAADDDSTALLLTRAALKADDFLVTVVDDGEVALAEFRRNEFDIVLLDVEMPGLDGFEIGAAIREMRGPDFPIVLVTGRDDLAFVSHAQALAADYVAKPVDWQSLPGLLRRLLMSGR